MIEELARKRSWVRPLDKEGREMSHERVEKILGCLGKGFDINNDFRLKYSKERLILVNEEKKTNIIVPGFGSFPDVSTDIKCDKGDRIRYRSDVLQFVQMSELLNRKSSIDGKVPSGLFNSFFGFSGGIWTQDALTTRCLAYDGYFISLFNLRLDRFPLILTGDVIRSVPSKWNPAALSRFIENYGTHIITGVSVGGQDVVFVRQDQTSNLQTSEIKEHLNNLGDELFSGTCTLPRLQSKKKDDRPKPPVAFNVFKKEQLVGDGFTSITSKKGITVLCSKRGGSSSAHGHCDWLQTVASSPEIINFQFTPITSILRNVPGKGYLSHAINLYLRYKPPLQDLEYFLEFQSSKLWAPMLNDLPLGPSSNYRSSSPTDYLQFNLMGPKLYVNTSQVTSVGSSPVTGMRLHLEGKKNNRLAIHLQHLSLPPNFISDKMNISPPFLRRGTDELSTEDEEERTFHVPIHNKRFSHVSTAPVKYDPRWKKINSTSGEEEESVFIVTGAQLVVKKHNSHDVLHLRLTYTKISDFFVERSVWEESGPGGSDQKSGFFSTMMTTNFSGVIDREKNPTTIGHLVTPRKDVVADSGVFLSEPPVPVQEQKLLRFVDTFQVCKGPEDSPGHWLVTGARLDLRKKKICLNVKFSLLGSCCVHQMRD